MNPRKTFQLVALILALCVMPIRGDDLSMPHVHGIGSPSLGKDYVPFPAGTRKFIRLGIERIDRALAKCKNVPNSVAKKELLLAFCDVKHIEVKAVDRFAPTEIRWNALLDHMHKAIENSDTEWKTLSVTLDRAGFVVDAAEGLANCITLDPGNWLSSIAGFGRTAVQWRAFELQRFDEVFDDKLACQVAARSVFLWNQHCECHGEYGLMMRLIRLPGDTVYATEDVTAAFDEELELEITGHHPTTFATYRNYSLRRVNLKDTTGNWFQYDDCDWFYCKYWVIDGKLTIYRYWRDLDNGERVKYKDYLIQDLQILSITEDRVVVYNPQPEE